MGGAGEEVGEREHGPAARLSGPVPSEHRPPYSRLSRAGLYSTLEAGATGAGPAWSGSRFGSRACAPASARCGSARADADVVVWAGAGSGAVGGAVARRGGPLLGGGGFWGGGLPPKQL